MVYATTPSYRLPVAPPIRPRRTPSLGHDPTALAEVVVNGGPNSLLRFMPVVPKHISRYYVNSHQAVTEGMLDDTIPKLMTEFPNKSLPWLNDVPGWQSYIHPNGALYLYNETQKTFTESKGITGSGNFRLLNGCMNALRRLPVPINIKDHGLVLQLGTEHNGDMTCKYYFVDYTKRKLFWLHKYVKAIDDVFDGIRVYDPSQIGHALEYQFWIFCSTYPNNVILPAVVLEDLKDIVIFARADLIMAENSLSPYSADDLSNIWELIKDLEGINAPHRVCIIARFMKSFSHSKFFNFHGQPYARPDADTSVFKEDNQHSRLPASLSLIFNAMLFGAQEVHYNQLQKVWVDRTIIRRRWGFFSSNLTAEWTGITMYSTVMLAVGMSFLAVPNMNIQESHSVGVIAIYISIIFITGSLIISLLLLRHIQSYGPNSFHAVANFLTKVTQSHLKMSALATIYSLPYAMLLWGMVFFSVAFLYTVFKSTTSAMLASVISGCTVVAIFILLFLWTASEVGIVRRLACLCKCFRRRQAKVDNIVELEADIANGAQGFPPGFPGHGVVGDHFNSRMEQLGTSRLAGRRRN